MRRDGGVGVVAGELDAVEVCAAPRLALDAQDGLALLVGVGQRRLELVVSGDEALREEEEAAGGSGLGSRGGGSHGPPSRRRTSISSVVWTMNMSCRSSIALSIQLLKGAALLAYSRCSSSIVSSCFSVFCRGVGVRRVWGSPQTQRVPPPRGGGVRAHLEGLPPAVGQGAQHVPLVADLLAPGVDAGRVVVIQLAAGSGGDTRSGVRARGARGTTARLPSGSVPLRPAPSPPEGEGTGRTMAALCGARRRGACCETPGTEGGRRGGRGEVSRGVRLGLPRVPSQGSLGCSGVPRVFIWGPWGV